MGFSEGRFSDFCSANGWSTDPLLFWAYSIGLWLTMVNAVSGVKERLSWPEKRVDGGKPQEAGQLARVEVSSLVLPSRVGQLLISVRSGWYSLLLLARDETREEQGRQIEVSSSGQAAI